MASALGLACDGDDTPAGVLPDGAAVDTQAQPDTSLSDAAPSFDAGPHAKAILVHASPDLPAVRVCLAIGSKADGSDAVIVPLPPLPDRTVSPAPYPGLFPGTGGALPDLGFDLSGKVVVPYVLLAEPLASDARTDAGPPPFNCAELLNPGGDASLTAGSFLKLPPVAAGTFASGKTKLVAVTGCIANEPKGSALCGASYNVLQGNVGLTVFDLDRAALASASQVGLQVAHLSAPTEGEIQGGPSVGIAAGLAGPLDAAAGDAFVEPVAIGVHYGEIGPSTATRVGLASVDETLFAINVLSPDGGVPLAGFGVPLSLVYTATTGQVSGASSYFATGANYTFVVVGDPAEPAFLDAGGLPVFNGRTLHFLAFPNDPVVGTYP